MDSVVDKLAMCRSGYHGCREQDLIYCIESDLYEMEFDGPVMKGDDKVVGHMARLVRKVAEWNERTVASSRATVPSMCCTTSRMNTQTITVLVMPSRPRVDTPTETPASKNSLLRVLLRVLLNVSGKRVDSLDTSMEMGIAWREGPRQRSGSRTAAAQRQGERHEPRNSDTQRIPRSQESQNQAARYRGRLT